MTIEQAQSIISKEFKWTVKRVLNGSVFTTILCDWNGEERVVTFSNKEQKITRITLN